MAARRTTRKKTTAPRRRSPKPMVNVLNTAQSLVLANATTRGLFGTDAVSFALDGWIRPQGAGSDNSWELSAAELVKGFTSGSFGFGKQYLAGGGTLQSAIQKNLRENGGQMVATLVVAPIAFKAFRKVAGKSLINPANRLIRASGMGGLVRI
jgi:hypothetical protein